MLVTQDENFECGGLEFRERLLKCLSDVVVHALRGGFRDIEFFNAVGLPPPLL